MKKKRKEQTVSYSSSFAVNDKISSGYRKAQIATLLGCFSCDVVLAIIKSNSYEVYFFWASVDVCFFIIHLFSV